MKVNISNDLYKIYKIQHKNIEYALNTILDTFDPDSYYKGFILLDKFCLKGSKIEISIGEDLYKKIQDCFEDIKISEELIESLLWISVLFPEV